MANYKEGYFVIPVGSSDVTVKVKDKFGNIRHSINPLQVTVMFVKVNTINVRTKSSDSVILLDFDNNQNAKIGLVELRTEMDKILNRVNKIEKEKENTFEQLQSGVDFTSLYQSGTVSATASDVKIEDRLTNFISQLRNDFLGLKNQEKIKVTLNPQNTFDESLNSYSDILDYVFTNDSDGTVDVYINGVYLFLGNTLNDIAIMSKDNGVTALDRIESGCKLYINTQLLGYNITPDDTISITYISKLV
jgi:hypothetical protein